MGSPSHSIKLYAWENAFTRWIMQVRNEQELKMLKKIGIYTVRTYNQSWLYLVDAHYLVPEFLALEWDPW